MYEFLTMPHQLSPFPCSACGQCCRRVNLSEQTVFLDRGDGICQYLDEKTNLCTIYENRTEVCRVEDYYKKYLIHDISWEKFVQMNLEFCEKWQKEK